MTRYVLSVVHRDGVPREVERFARLPLALLARDQRRSKANPRHEHWMVHDSEDEERGYLDWAEENGINEGGAA